MGFRLNQRHIIALNFLLVGCLAYFAALSVNDIVALRLAPSQAPVPVVAASTGDFSLSNQPRTAYQEIVNRDIFNLAAPPQVHHEVVEQLDLHLKLLGVSLVSGGKSWAIIEDRSGTQSVYRVGQMIEGSGKMVEVDSDRVIVDHNGKRVAINLPREEMPGPIIAAKPVAIHGAIDTDVDTSDKSDDAAEDADAYDPNVEDLGDDHYKIPRDTVTHTLGNLSAVLTQIRAMPNIQNGRNNGFELSEIEPGSVFDEMGLQEGDVLHSVNGQPITDPAQAIQLMGELNNASSVSIQVIRAGQPTTLSYQIQ
jgi:type II secretion system protein C